MLPNSLEKYGILLVYEHLQGCPNSDEQRKGC
jgi:hypothetical protein